MQRSTKLQNSKLTGELHLFVSPPLEFPWELGCWCLVFRRLPPTLSAPGHLFQRKLHQLFRRFVALLFLKVADYSMCFHLFVTKCD